MSNHDIDNLFEVYFSCMRSEYYFVQMMKAFTTPGMEGYGREYVCCVLSSAFKKGEEEYFGDTGVKLCISEPVVPKDVELIISNEEFIKRLHVECTKFIALYPDKTNDISEYLKKLKKDLGT